MGIAVDHYVMDYHNLSPSGGRGAANPPGFMRDVLDMHLHHYSGAPEGYVSGGLSSSVLSVAETFSGSGSFLKVISRSDRVKSTLSKVSKAFSLTKEELASVCRVQSRKTLYNWLDGGAPRKSAADRLFKLGLLADAWLNSGYVLTKSQLMEPVVNGKSVIDLLQEENLDEELVVFAGSRLGFSTDKFSTIQDPFA